VLQLAHELSHILVPKTLLEAVQLIGGFLDVSRNHIVLFDT
jgi:hypothetical protein